jgi:endonuclease-3
MQAIVATMAAVVFPPDPDRVEAIFHRFEALNAHPKPELKFQDPYTLLVAVVLSAQATDVSVNKATQKLFAVADTPKKMLALGEAGVTPFISSIGLYRNKARHVVELSRMLVEQYGGKPPMDRTALQSLPGVGRKTASVVLNELGFETAIAVDTHVFRVSHRLGLANASVPEKVERQLMEIIPEPYLSRAHHWLILHGRYICTALRPKCLGCPIADLCPSRGLFTQAASKPTAKPKAGGAKTAINKSKPRKTSRRPAR